MYALSYLPSIIERLFSIYQILIIVYILMSWVPQIKQSPVGQIIGRMVEPFLSIFRRFIPPIGMFDVSPIVAIIALRFVQAGLVTIITWVLMAIYGGWG